ncbi:MAG: VCBS repeat-containing protein [Patescibacteria group bacterium]
MPAIFCWLGSIMPPTISAGNCSPNSSVDIADLINKHYGADKNGNGIPDYQEDSNGNGIIDGAEYVKDGAIKLSATPKRAPYRESVALAAILENKDGVQVYVDSVNDVSFDVTKVVAYSGGIATEKYRRGASGELGNSVNVKDYVNFGQISVKAKEGKATYVLTTKDRDADVYFDATVAPRDKDGKAAFVKTSNEAKLEIRAETLQIGLTSSGSSISSYAKAGEYSEVSFPIKKIGKGGTALAVAFPVTVRVTDDDSGKSVADPVVTNKDVWTYTGNLLKQSANYRFEFTDKEGVTGSQVLTVTAGAATKLELAPSSTLFVKNETVTVLAKVVDQYGNYAKGDLVDLHGKIEGGGYFLENKSDELNRSIVEGFTTFEISTSDGGKNLKFSLEIKNRNLSATTSFRSLDYAKAVVDVENRDKIVVGKEPHAVRIKLVDGDGKILTGFDGVAALNFPQLSGVFDTNYLAIKDGLSTTGALLSPKYVAGKDLKIETYVPGVKDVEGNVLTVYPDVPMRVSLETEKPAIEARTGETETVTAKLFDRYGNLAYNHADGAYSSKFSIPELFHKYLRFPGKVFAKDSQFKEGIATVTVETTRLPGSPYVIAEVAPGLESNSYSVTDKSGSTVTISGYSKNAVVVDSYYLWNKEKVNKLQYNGLYTVLAGADYGNFTERDYLGGEILFNPDSRSMAVTTLVNDATERQKTFSVTPGGKTELPSGDSLVTAEVSSVAGRTSVGFYDPFYKEYVARAYFNFAEGSDRIACKNDGQEGIDNCEVPTGKPFTLLKGYGDATAVSQGGLALVLKGARILEIDANGAVSALPSVRLEVDKDNSKNLLAVKVVSNNQEVGYFAAKLRADSVVLTKPAEIKKALAENPGKVIVEAVSSRYFPQDSFLGNSSRGAKGISFYSNRDLDGSNADREMIGSADKSGFEEYREKQGVGWEGQNKTLLEFAGGSSVGEATRFNSTYSTVNLGDPVFRVKQATNEGSYDRTLGTRLMDAVGDTIESYKKFDFNGDSYEDLVVFFESGKIRLFANLQGSYKDMGYLAYVSDAGKARKGVGDFAGDGYSDIAAVTNKGQLIILDNKEGKFTRKEAVIVDDKDNLTQIRGKIVQLETYDMDGDGKTDLVVSDESGELNVLYGKVLNGETVFTKNILDSDLALRLSSAERSDGGAVYFDGIPQLKNPTVPDQARYLAESKSLAAAGEGETIPPEVMRASVDAKLYYVHAYQVAVEYTGGTLNSQLEGRLSGAIGNDPENPSSPNTALQKQVMDAMSGAQAASASGSFKTSGTYNETRYKTFLKSEFAEDRDLRVVKTMKDVNSDPLKSEDPVEITVTLGNSGSTTMKNVAYLDSFDKSIFSETDTPFYTVNAPSYSHTGTLDMLPDSSYDYLFDGFDLRPGETATIKYSLKTNTVQFGKFVVGQLETDDTYGDVAMRANNIC